MKQFIFILFFALGAGNSFAQSPDTLWTKLIGGKGNEQAYCIQQTSDGGFIITGKTTSSGAGKSDVYLVKTDNNGNVLWTKTYGDNGDDWGTWVQQTSDGGYIIVCGTTSSLYHNSLMNVRSVWDVYLIKTDAKGKEQWGGQYNLITNIYGQVMKELIKADSLEIKTEATGVVQAPDGGYVICGSVIAMGTSREGKYDSWECQLVFKTDAKGNTLSIDEYLDNKNKKSDRWIQILIGTTDSRAQSIQLTKDGGFITAGNRIDKIDAYGNNLWENGKEWIRATRI